jgi:L-threonylcarbamoyladenylate synthase
MAADIIKIDPAHPEFAFVRCRDVISRGGVVIYPTDTFYGLGVDPANAEAVKRLFSIKGRSVDQPILLLIRDGIEVGNWVAEVNAEARRLMAAYWPGPLTLVFTAGSRVLPLLTGGSGTIGLRVPGSELTRQLLSFIGTALTGTSANRSGQESPTTSEQAASSLGSQVDLILDVGAVPGGLPSTIADVSAGRVCVIREGAVKLSP